MDDNFDAQDEHLLHWLALIHARGVGSRTAGKLLDFFGSAEEICTASTPKLEQTGLKRASIDSLKNPDQAAIDTDLNWLSGADNHILTLADADYPDLLKSISDPPPVLFLHGDRSILSTPQLAIVGSRNPTTGGKQTARDFARHLAASGLTITSGLALGIDGAAHEGAIENGTSIAVMGTGLDRVYPARHRQLAHEIAASGGALVSEFPPGTAPRAANFPRRNRIISGLSVGTLTVEAALQSGSLITARLAMEQGREVFAIPGSIHNPLARGCHALIRDGAKLVETSTDILEELTSILGTYLQTNETSTEENDSETNAHLDNEYQALLNSMGFDPVTTDQLKELTNFTTKEISSMLLLLELDGYVSSAPGGRFSRTNKTPQFK